MSYFHGTSYCFMYKPQQLSTKKPTMNLEVSVYILEKPTNHDNTTIQYSDYIYWTCLRCAHRLSLLVVFQFQLAYHIVKATTNFQHFGLLFFFTKRGIILNVLCRLHCKNKKWKLRFSSLQPTLFPTQMNQSIYKHLPR